MQKRKEEGITLVTLVVTIVVLIILTSITIVATIGDNGLITVLEQGRENVINDIEGQKQKLNEIEEEREKTGITKPNGGGTNKPTRDDTGVNSPVLGDGMIPIKNNGENWVICSTDDIEWFNYTKQESSTENGGTSKWANIMLSDGKYKFGENAKVGTIVQDKELGSMFVWIPRYAYKITYYTDNNKNTISSNNTIYGKVDIKFIKGNENITWDENKCKYADDNTLTQNDYIVHPAFTENVSLGGGFGEISGIWIGKFEASRSDATSTLMGTSEILKVVPNVASWRNISISQMYSISKQYNENLNSHMLKNSEWGAVAYLSHSEYGRNGTEISVNQCESYITGAGAGKGLNNTFNNTYTYSTGNFETTYAYNTSQGKKASTTGNVYGIYDLVGGANELTATYYNNSDELVNGRPFANTGKMSDKYSISYSGTELKGNYIKGDATYETRKWNSDNSNFVNSETPFLAYGGYYSLLDNAGIFGFDANDGKASNYTGFRACLIVE